MVQQLRLLGVGAREIAQWLGAFTVYGEQWGPFPITYLGAHKPHIIPVGDPVPSSNLHRLLHTYDTHTYT